MDIGEPGMHGAGPQAPLALHDALASNRSQSFQYVFPSQPQTGAQSAVQGAGLATHVPVAPGAQSRTSHVSPEAQSSGTPARQPPASPSSVGTSSDASSAPSSTVPSGEPSPSTSASPSASVCSRTTTAVSTQPAARASRANAVECTSRDPAIPDPDQPPAASPQPPATIAPPRAPGRP